MDTDSETRNRKGSVAVFTRRFLPPTATFIYRQAMGVQAEYDLCALCEKRENPDLFPFEPVFSPPAHIMKPGVLENIREKLRRAVFGFSVYVPEKAYDFWKKHLMEMGCSLIHAHFAYDGIVALPLSEDLGIPLIVTLHGFDISRMLSRRGYSGRLGELFQRADLIIAVSDCFRRRAMALGCPANKVITHYIGVPLQEFHCAGREEEKESLTVLQVSSFQRKKGQKYSLRAFGEALKAGFRGKLILAGDGPMKDPCMKLAGDMGISDSVDFPGAVDARRIPFLMDSADIFIHPSITAEDGDTEGIPTALMEAMASGLPVISTRHAGIPELVESGNNGLLAEEGDVPALSSFLLTLAGDGSLRRRMGRDGRKTVEERFNMDVQNRILAGIYEKVRKK